ncbi:hypothetical protein ES703_76163 [subsurface metagenome]
MPILICLKEPRINIIVDGNIKDESEKQWDEIFHNQILMVKRQEGLNMVIPLLRECNVAFMQEVSQEEIDEQRESAKNKQQGSVITKPQFVIPHGGRKGRGN